MEDRYLFKAKDCNSIWRAGLLIGLQECRCAIEEKDGSKWACNSKTICQCTGLKDKNGKLIWENDVVGFWDTYSTENGQAEMDCIGKVVWDDETISFQVTNRLSAESYEVLDECSVIGNIFDNPELLESEG